MCPSVGPGKEQEQKPQVDRVCSVLGAPNYTAEPCGGISEAEDLKTSITGKAWVCFQMALPWPCGEVTLSVRAYGACTRLREQLTTFLGMDGLSGSV